MRRLALVLLVGCGGKLDESRKPDSGTVHGDAQPDSTQLTLSIVGKTKDRVSRADTGVVPDGDPDGELTLTTTTSFDALILVTTTSDGVPCCGQQWDTLVMDDPIPSLGFSFMRGTQTVVLGVFQGDTKLNDANARVSITPGTYSLFAEDSGYFKSGQSYRLFGRSNGAWLASKIAQWP